MRRTVIAVAWLASTTLPILLAIVFKFGCCVLPFHAYLHRALPLCGLAAAATSADHQKAGQGSLPASEKQDLKARVFTTAPRATALARSSVRQSALARLSSAAYRNQVTLGAIRCDQDVGWQALTCTLLI